MLRHNGMPECFPTRKVWELYKETSRGPAGRGHFGACTDCLPEYKQRMEAQGRCQHSDIQFRHDEDGFIEGYLPPQTEWQKKAERIVARASRKVIAVFKQSGQLKCFEFGSALSQRQREIDLIGVYGPGADLDEVAEDLKAAA